MDIEPLAAIADPDAALRACGLRPSRWEAPAATEFAPHRHPQAKRLYVIRGSIRFNQLALSAPSAIRIPARVEHRATVGGDGVVCIEAFEDDDLRA